MKLTLIQGLLVTTVTIRHRDHCMVVENMVVTPVPRMRGSMSTPLRANWIRRLTEPTKL